MRKVLTFACILVGILSLSMGASAVESASVPPIKQTRFALYLDAREAHQMKEELKDKVLFIDVRTRSEVSYLGMPTNADAHIPYVEHPFEAPWEDKSNRFVLDTNSEFSAELTRRLTEKRLDKNSPVILICRSGDRSARAANLLKDLGFEKVFSVVDGFEGDMAREGPQAGKRMVNGWKNAGLPWTYKLDKEKLFFPRY